MDTNYIRWNLPNWITIFLMGAIGYLAIGSISAAIQNGVGKFPWQN
jgi:hypothetical protein